MPDIWSNLIGGFRITLEPANFLVCFLGVAIGTLIGVLPGIGPAGAIALLLPATYYLSPVSAIILLAGIYYGAMYGGSTTSILMNIPGEAASIVTCLDGHEMAKQGRAGPALGMAAFGSFIAGTLGLVGLMVLAAPLASLALGLGPPEYFGLMAVGLMVVVYLGRGSMLRSLIMAAVGLGLSYIGVDTITGRPRFTFGVPELVDGIGLIPLVMGLFGVSEVLLNLERRGDQPKALQTRITGLLPTREDWRDGLPSIFRGTVTGFLLGILPGSGPIMSTFAAYALEKRVSRHPERFGTGVIQGVAAAESANNAASSSSFVPLFALGIPSNGILALFLGALIMHGIRPGPNFITERPEIFWGVVASMYIGNILLLVLNLPLIGLWVWVLRVPYFILFPLILLFCVIGTFGLNNSPFDVLLMAAFGIAGYFLRRLRYDLAPLVFAFVLGPMFELALRQSLILSNGSVRIFLERPVSAVCLLVIAALAAVSLLRAVRRGLNPSPAATIAGGAANDNDDTKRGLGYV